MNIVCAQCGTTINIVGDMSLVRDLLGKGLWGSAQYPCIRCESKATQQQGHVLHPTLELTPEEYFRALNGMGTPEEASCSPEVVASLLRDGVSSIDAEEKGGKTLLKSILLKSGLRMHLWVSPVGAVVYKITKGDGNVQRVSFCTEGASVCTTQDRAQGGHPD